MWGEISVKSSCRRDCSAVPMCRFVVLVGEIQKIYTSFTFPLLGVSKYAKDSCVTWLGGSHAKTLESSLI